MEHVVGIVQVKDLLATLFAKNTFDLKLVATVPSFIPETAPALKALELFKQTGAAMALVSDEYGAITGLITLNDILEALVGGIASKEEQEEPSAVRREDGSWLVDGIVSIDDLRSLLELGAFPQGSDGEFNTVGGLVLTHLKRMAKVADHVEVDGYRFEVVDMDGRRIDKVLIVPPPPAPHEVGAPLESGGSDGTDAY
jgi:putative hemolysin